jgi:hypothetical protein
MKEEFLEDNELEQLRQVQILLWENRRFRWISFGKTNSPINVLFFCFIIGKAAAANKHNTLHTNIMRFILRSLHQDKLLFLQ